MTSPLQPHPLQTPSIHSSPITMQSSRSQSLRRKPRVGILLRTQSVHRRSMKQVLMSSMIASS